MLACNSMYTLVTRISLYLNKYHTYILQARSCLDTVEILPIKRRNAPPMTAGQELHAPWPAHINYIFLLVLCRFICLRLTVVLHCRIHICIRILRLSKNGITRSNLAHSYLITITDVFLLDSKHTC